MYFLNSMVDQTVFQDSFTTFTDYKPSFHTTTKLEKFSKFISMLMTFKTKFLPNKAHNMKAMKY